MQLASVLSCWRLCLSRAQRSKAIATTRTCLSGQSAAAELLPATLSPSRRADFAKASMALPEMMTSTSARERSACLRRLDFACCVMMEAGVGGGGGGGGVEPDDRRLRLTSWFSLRHQQSPGPKTDVIGRTDVFSSSMKVGHNQRSRSTRKRDMSTSSPTCPSKCRLA